MVAARVAARGVADSLGAVWVATARATVEGGGSEGGGQRGYDGSERPSDSEVGGEGSAGEGDGNEGGGGGISSGEGDGSHSCVLRTHSVETVSGWQHVHGQECPRSGSSSVAYLHD